MLSLLSHQFVQLLSLFSQQTFLSTTFMDHIATVIGRYNHTAHLMCRTEFGSIGRISVDYAVATTERYYI